MTRLLLRKLFAGLSAALLAPSFAPAQTPGGGSGFGRGVRDIPSIRADSDFLALFRPAVSEASKATVRVQCDGKDAALGTVVGADGWVLTKYSQLTGPVAIKLPDREPVPSKLVGVHEGFDLAVLKADVTGLTPVRFASTGTAPVGRWLAATAPGGGDPAAVGVYSVPTRTPPVPRGGRPRAASVPRAAANGNAGYLGLSATPAEAGAQVTTVDPAGAAGKAGVKEGDVILSVRDTVVADQDAIIALLSGTRAGDEVSIKLVRDGKEIALRVTLAQRPAARPDMNLRGSELSERRAGFPTFFQTDMVILPKDCGGPVCDLDGRVLGVMLARAGRTESHAAPAEAVTAILPDLMGGKLSPKVVLVPGLEKRLIEIKSVLSKEEEAKAAADKKVKEAKETLKRLEADQAAAEKRAKEAADLLGKTEGELKKARDE